MLYCAYLSSIHVIIKQIEYNVIDELGAAVALPRPNWLQCNFDCELENYLNVTLNIDKQKRKSCSGFEQYKAVSLQ